MGGNVDTGLDKGDAWGGRGLAGNGDIGLSDLERLPAHVDDAAHFEHDDAWTFRLQRRFEAAGAIRGEGGDAEDATAAAAGRGGGPADCAGESCRLVAGRGGALQCRLGAGGLDRDDLGHGQAEQYPLGTDPAGDRHGYISPLLAPMCHRWRGRATIM